MAEPTASSSTSQTPKPKPKPKKNKPKSQPDKTSDTIPAAENPTRTRNDGADAGMSLDPTTTLALDPGAAVPEGLIHADYDVEFGEFDYDALKADDTAELWLVRAPSAVRLLLSSLPHTTAGVLKCENPTLFLLCYYR